MFERFTDAARRALFHARAEAARSGSPCIDIQHFLAGLIQADATIAAWVLGKQSLDELRAELGIMPPAVSRVSATTDQPLSPVVKRVLAYGKEEADNAVSRAIAPGHLLAGLLRENHVVKEILERRGLDIGACIADFCGGVAPGVLLQARRLLDGLPPERLPSALEIIQLLAAATVDIAVKTPDREFTIRHNAQ